MKMKRRLPTQEQEVELEYTTVTKTDGNQAKMKELVDTVAVNEPRQDEIHTLVDSLEWKKKKIYSVWTSPLVLTRTRATATLYTTRNESPHPQSTCTDNFYFYLINDTLHT